MEQASSLSQSQFRLHQLSWIETVEQGLELINQMKDNQSNQVLVDTA